MIASWTTGAYIGLLMNTHETRLYRKFGGTQFAKDLISAVRDRTPRA